MILPKQVVKATTKSPEVLVLYGMPKIGKTSVTTALQDYLLVDIEQGSNFLDAVKVQPNSVFQINGLCEEVQKQPTPPYKMVVIDTLDQLEQWAEREATRVYQNTLLGKSFRGESVLELPKGGGYFWLRQAFYKYFMMLRHIAPRAVFIGHLRDSLLTQDGKEVSYKDLDLTGKVRNIVCSAADGVGRAYRNSAGEFVLSFRTSESVTCGSRCPHLSGKEFKFHNPATWEDWKQIYID